MTPRELDKEATRLARQQHGVVKRVQLERMGATREQLRHRQFRGDWVPILPGVVRLAWAQDSFYARAMAAALWAGPEAVVSHASAAFLWGLRREPGSDVHLSVPRRFRKPANWVVFYRTDVMRRLRRVRAGVPVTSPARTLADLAQDAAEDLESTLEDAVRRELVTLAELLSLQHQHGHRPGVRRFRKLLGDEPRDAFRVTSALEQRALRLFARAKLPRPVCQYPIACPGGVATVDFAWPQARVAVEADGYRFHSGRNAWENDLARHNALVVAGWKPLRLSWQRLPSSLGLLKAMLDEASLEEDLLDEPGHGEPGHGEPRRGEAESAPNLVASQGSVVRRAPLKTEYVGELAEWSKAPDSKSGVPVTVP